jgi:hypothetical protein
MNGLKLISANEYRTRGDWSPDDFHVILHTGETVGRIYAGSSAGITQPDCSLRSADDRC